MPKAAAHAPPTPSRLAHTLNALGVAASAAPRAGFADKLAELIDLSGAIALSEPLRGWRRVTVLATGSRRPRWLFQPPKSEDDCAFSFC